MIKIIFGNHKVIINNKHLVCFHGGKKYKEKMKLLGSKMKVKIMCIETQVSGTP